MQSKLTITLAGDYISSEFTDFENASFRGILWGTDPDTGMQCIAWVAEGRMRALRKAVKSNGGVDAPAMYREAYAAALADHKACWQEKQVICPDAYTSHR